MKAVVYSIKPFEKEFLAIANQKKHEITLISNPLNFDTLSYAANKDVIIVSGTDNVSGEILEKLAGLHVKYMISRSVDMDYIDQATALRYGIQLANTKLSITHETKLTMDGFRETASQIIEILDLFKSAKGADKFKNKVNYN